MNKEYSDDIRLNDDAEFTITIEAACDAITEGIKNLNRLMTEAVERSPLVIRVRKEDIKNEDVLRQIDEQETATLKEACAIIEHNNACFNAPAKVCWGKTCKECEYYIDPDIMHKAVNRLLDHAKKSLENTEKSIKPSIEQCKRYIRCSGAEYSFCQGIDCEECPYHINHDKLYDEIKQIVAYFDKEEKK